MLEVSGADDHHIYILSVIEFVIVATGSNIHSGAFLDKSLSLVPSAAPDVRNGSKLEIHLLGVNLHGRNQGAPASVGETDNAHIHPVVGTEDAAVTFWGKSHRTEANSGSGEG